MINEITEVCPHCESEITMQWNVKNQDTRHTVPFAANASCCVPHAMTMGMRATTRRKRIRAIQRSRSEH